MTSCYPYTCNFNINNNANFIHALRLVLTAAIALGVPKTRVEWGLGGPYKTRYSGTGVPHTPRVPVSLLHRKGNYMLHVPVYNYRGNNRVYSCPVLYCKCQKVTS